MATVFTNRRGVKPVLFFQLAPAFNPVGVQITRRNRRANGAARFGHMGAVVEFARRGQFGDVAKDLIHARFGVDQSQFAHARCVDQPPACKCRAQVAICCRMAALGVASANVLRGVDDIRQAVLDRRFSDAR